MEYKLDEVDLKILRLMQENGRINNSDVAKELGMAPSAVLERVKKLENKDVILAYHARVNPEALDQKMLSFIFIKVDEIIGDEETGRLLAEIPEVLEVHDIAGDDGYMIKVRTTDSLALVHLMRNSLSKIQGIISTRTIIVLQTVKEENKLIIPGKVRVVMGAVNTNGTNKSTVIAAYIVVYFVWGSTFFFIHKALSDFSPFVLGTLRFFSASLLLLTYCKMKGYKLFNKKIVKQACITGFLLLFIDMGALIWAEQHVSSGIAAIMAAAAALWFIILDKPQWKNNFSSIPTVLGLLLGFVGVIMLFAEQINIASDESQKLLNIFCMVLLILGSIAWTAGSLYSKYSKDKNTTEGEDLHVMVKTSWQMITAGVLFCIVAISNGEFAAFDPMEVSVSGWFSLGYLITFGSILAFGSYIWLIQNRPVVEVSTYAYVNPVVAVALSYFFTDDIITSLQIGGLAVVLLSVGLMNWDLYKNSKFIKVFNKKRKESTEDKEELNITN